MATQNTFNAYKKIRSEMRAQEKKILTDARNDIREWVLKNKGVDIKTDRGGVYYRLPDSHILNDEHDFISIVVESGDRPGFIKVPRKAIFPG